MKPQFITLDGVDGAGKSTKLPSSKHGLNGGAARAVHARAGRNAGR